MKIKLLLTLLGISIFALSCKKNSSVDVIANEDINAIVAPSNFKWQTARDVTFTMGIHDARFPNSTLHVLEIFIGDPATGGKSIAKGAVSLITSYKFKAEIPAPVEEVYVTKTAPDGSKFTDKVILNSTDISISIGSTAITQSISAIKFNNSKSLSAVKLNIPTETSPDCNTGCDIEITKSSSVNLNGKTACVTQDGVTLDMSKTKSGTLRICAKNVIIDELKITDNITIIVASTGNVMFRSATWTGNGVFKNFGTSAFYTFESKGTFYNAGTINTGDITVESGTFSNIATINTTGNAKIKGTFENTGSLNTKDLTMESSLAKVNSSGNITLANNINLTGTFENSGNLIIKGFYNSNSNPTFTNSGIVTIANNMTIAGTLTNSGTITSGGGSISINNSSTELTNNGVFTASSARMTTQGTVINGGSMTSNYFTVNSGTFTNNCKLIVNLDFINTGTVSNYSYIQVGGDSYIQKNLTLYNGAMFQTKSLQSLDGKVIGVGNTSLFRVTNQGNGSVNGSFEGTLKYCDANRTLTADKFSDKNIQGCDIYIAKTNCNPQGYGTAPAPIEKDSDNDGIIDLMDNYPNDPTRAFNNQSLNYLDGGSTIAFEDSWPKQGDYDLNDAVITYRYLVITNASNKVVQIKADYKLIASGGNNAVGAGIQFNIPSVKAKNFTGTNGASLENGQDSIVVILFKNSRDIQKSWNTIPGESVAEAKDFSISFDITDGPAMDSFGIGTYNPFIFNNSIGRSHETHLFGKHPTKLGNTSLFGKEDDGSTGTKYYSTKSGLPWALTVPTAPFKYPIEKISITATYLRFADWVTSSGTSSKDWYNNTSTGYLNSKNIYTTK
ncbi:LruC domain-containing protein [Pedobacter sp. CG_S7]|uniref:LruC domain-containing protein n=1 Tax=Pedobacter sp. CG_S7 TaxID=3143930 RepID=UPI00339492B7